MSNEGNEALLKELREQIETLEYALKHAKASNDNLTDANALLIAELRVAQAVGSVTGRIGETVLQEMRTFAIDAERAKAALKRVANAILNTLDLTYNNTFRLKEHGEKYLKELDETSGGENTPYIVGIMRGIANLYADAAKQAHSTIVDEIVRYTGTSDYDPVNNPELCLQQILKLSEVAHLWRVTTRLTLYGYHFAEDERAIAWEIVDQCRRYGSPTMRTIEVLGQDWIDKHLPEPPRKYVTLIEGLQVRMEELRSRKTRKVFAKDTNTDPRTLLRFENWLNALDQFASERPVYMFEGID